MKSLLVTLVLLSSTVIAAELPARIYEALGTYESEQARTADSYMANDLSSFNVFITPDSKAIIHFEAWDIEIKIESDLSFYQSTISECQDPGCSGIADMEGKILFKKIDGKEIPVAQVTMFFYADISEDVDCDEVDCDNMDYDDYWKEWEETYEFKLTGSFSDQLPAFRPTASSLLMSENIAQCAQLITNTLVKCASTAKFHFDKEMNPENLQKLMDFLGASFNHKVSKETALEVAKSHIENLLLQTKIYSFNGEETQAYNALKRNLEDFLAAASDISADYVLSSLTRVSNWRTNPSMDFLFVDTVNADVVRLRLEL